MSSRLKCVVAPVFGVALALMQADALAARKLVDESIPPSPLNVRIPGGKFVGQYHLQVWTNKVLLDGYWYVRVAGKKVAKDDHHVVVEEDFPDKLPTTFKKKWKLGDLGSAEASLKIEKKQARVALKGKVSGVRFTLVDKRFKW